MRINLLPQEYRPQPVVNPFRLFLMITGSILCLVAIGFAVLEWTESESAKARLRVVERELAIYQGSKEKLAKIDEMRCKIDKYRKEQAQFKGTYQLYLSIINGVAASLSDNIWLSNIAAGPEGKVNVKGETMDFASIGDLLKSLGNLPDFQSCKLQRITEIEDDSLKTYQFEVQLYTGRVQQYAN